MSKWHQEEDHSEEEEEDLFEDMVEERLQALQDQSKELFSELQSTNTQLQLLLLRLSQTVCQSSIQCLQHQSETVKPTETVHKFTP